MPRPLLPPWLRRGLEAAIAAAIVAIASLAGDRIAAGGAVFPLSGPTGALILAPAVFVLGVLTTAYPIAMAATRADAVLGAVAAFLVGADLAIVFTPSPVGLDRVGLTLPAGVLVGLLALAPAAVGLAASQIAAPLGFGRRAGAVAAVASAAAGVVVVVAVALLA